jgi:hypothetical protein
MLIPILHVEGKDDVSVISNLLLRYGVDTERGKRYLVIKDQGNVDAVLELMPEVIRASTDRPVGFVIDIDIKITERWNVVKSKLRQIGISPPEKCPSSGYFGNLPDYPCKFGVWLMPDCSTDDCKLEHLIRSLIQANDPLWNYAQTCVSEAERLVDEANKTVMDEANQWNKFRAVDRIKAEVHTWLAWQYTPGAPFGAAINDRILRHDSAQVINFLRWLRDLYGFTQLANL